MLSPTSGGGGGQSPLSKSMSYAVPLVTLAREFMGKHDLVEDKFIHEYSYVDYLCMVHCARRWH